jgi:predicted RNA binding protein YcfA (HicA-like mRNA interferase family)
MPSKAPRLTAKEVIKQLKSAGFVEVAQTGSHLKLFNAETRRTVIVPIHSNKIVSIGTLKARSKRILNSRNHQQHSITPLLSIVRVGFHKGLT